MEKKTKWVEVPGLFVPLALLQQSGLGSLLPLLMVTTLNLTCNLFLPVAAASAQKGSFLCLKRKVDESGRLSLDFLLEVPAFPPFLAPQPSGVRDPTAAIGRGRRQHKDNDDFLLPFSHLSLLVAAV